MLAGARRIGGNPSARRPPGAGGPSFFGLFPILFLSGTLTPVESMPPFLQSLSLASPLRTDMEIILGVFLKGPGWRELWDEAARLLLIGAVLFGFALRVFRRRIV